MGHAAFEIAAATTIGRDHARAGRPNQDAFAWRLGDGTVAAVVADGCSSGSESEVGARLGARLCAAALLRHAALSSEPEAMWRRVRADVLASLQPLLPSLGGPPEDAVRELLLFTLVGVLVGPRVTSVAHVGDGVIALDGSVVTLGPFPDNAPPYLGYALLGHTDDTSFRVRAFPTAQIEWIAVGTDGAAELPIGDLVVDAIFANPDALRRRLTLLGREPGRLPDDATLVVARRGS